MTISSNVQNKLDPYLSANVVDDTLIIDMISFLYQSRRQAAFTLWTEDHQVTLYFSQGSVHYAQSTLKHHRLGSILARRGLITETKIQALLASSSHMKLGELLVSLNYLNAEELQESLQTQALLIIQASLSGDMTRFELSEYILDELPLHLNINAQSLLLEVLRQQDEVNALLNQLPPLKDPLVITSSPSPEEHSKYSPFIQYALGRCDGVTPLGQLIFKSPLSALESVQIYLKLIKENIVKNISPEHQSAPLQVPNHFWFQAVETPPLFSDHVNTPTLSHSAVSLSTAPVESPTFTITSPFTSIETPTSLFSDKEGLGVEEREDT